MPYDMLRTGTRLMISGRSGARNRCSWAGGKSDHLISRREGKTEVKADTRGFAGVSGACLVLVLFIALHASADDSKPAQPMPMQSCEDDRVRFCSDKKGSGDILSCLIEHDKEITTACKQELDRSLQMRREASSRGDGALSFFGGLNAMGPPVPLISYDGRYSPGSQSPSFTENKVSISAPVYKSDVDTVSLSLASGILHLGDSLFLDSGKKVPTDLYRIETGVQYFHQLPEKKYWSIKGSVGYAGDKPFENSHDLTYSFNANYGFPGSGKGFWIVSVYFSNNGPLGNYVPVPGVGYFYKTDTFTGLFGIPVTSMQWTPVFPWSFSLSVFGPLVRAEVGYGSIDRIQYFTGFYWTRQSYIPSERDNDKDRLTIEEKKAAVGFRTPILGPMIGELQAGRAFDRSAYIGDHLFNKDGGSVSIESDWYVSTSIKMKF